MITEFGRMTLLVDDYDDALDFYVETLGLDVLWDGDLSDGTRTVHVGVRERGNAGIWLLRATDEEARERVGDQTAREPCFVLYTDDCRGAYETLRERDVTLLGSPEEGPTSVFVHFEDPYGNEGVLVELAEGA